MNVARLRGLRILVVEDNEVNQLVAEELLALEGALVSIASNGREAMQRLQECSAADYEDRHYENCPYDIVLSDVQMPEMDGYALARCIAEFAPALPVIGLTAHAMAEERARCLAAGMREHLTKPIDLDLLVATILRLLPPERVAAIAAAIVAAISAAEPTCRHPAAAVTSGTESTFPPAPFFAPDPAVIDWDALLERFSGRQAFIDTLIATTLTVTADKVAALRAAINSNDLEAIAYVAHGLKGMAANMKARQVHELGIETEAAARSSQAEALILAERLAIATETLMAVLQKKPCN
jgi:CheY-like chemotaxis protein